MTAFLSLMLFVLIPVLAAAQEWKPVGAEGGGQLVTNGRYLAVYPSGQFEQEMANHIVIVHDLPSGPEIVIDTIITGELRDVAFIGDTLWVVADSVFSIDPVTRRTTYEGFSKYVRYTEVAVAALPGGIGIAVDFAVWYRAYGSTDWVILANVRWELTQHALLGTDDGFLLVSTVPDDDIMLYPFYAHRFTMDGTQLGDSVTIGTQFSRNDLAIRAHDLIRQGSAIYLTTFEGANVVSTDQGATWTTVSSPLNSEECTPTPTALWWPKDSLMYFSDPLRQNIYAYAIPPIGGSMDYRQAVCLDHSCYTYTELGLSYIPRPVVSVAEDHTSRTTFDSTATTAQIINVLGEHVGTLPIINGLLAPFDPSQLPLQPLWAVSGDVVVRVR